jgi:hypothetical protein
MQKPYATHCRNHFPLSPIWPTPIVRDKHVVRAQKGGAPHAGFRTYRDWTCDPARVAVGWRGSVPGLTARYSLWDVGWLLREQRFYCGAHSLCRVDTNSSAHLFDSLLEKPKTEVKRVVDTFG